MIHHGRLQQFVSCAFLMVIFSACITQVTSIPTEKPTAGLPTFIPTSTPVPTQILTPTPNSNEQRATILAAINAMNNTTYRYQSETVLANDETHTTVLEYVPPDRYHIISDSISELTVIGDVVYIKQNDLWTDSEMPASAIIDPDTARKLEESISDTQFIGTKSLNGKSMAVYRYNSTTNIDDKESTTITTIWIGVADNLPYKMVVDGETATVNADSGNILSVGAKSTIYFEYDPAIQIESIN